MLVVLLIVVVMVVAVLVVAVLVTGVVKQTSTLNLSFVELGSSW